MIPFFRNTGELKKFVPGIDSKEDIDDFAPYAITAKKEVIKIIGKPLWLAFQKKFETGEDVKGLENLRGAMASFIAIAHALYDTIKRNNSERKVYKYQYNEIVAQLTERAHFYMSELLEEVKDNNDFKNTPTAKEQEKLLVKDYRQFGRHYNIDDSAYFFHISVFLQKEVIRNYLQARNLSEANESIREKAEIAVVYHTVALAIERLDAMVLPKSIRKDLQINSEFIKRTDNDLESKKRLIASLRMQGDKALLDLDSEMQKNKRSDYVQEDLSEPSDKFFMPC